MAVYKVGLMKRTRNSISKVYAGFSLVELAVVLAVLGIVLIGAILGTSEFRETAKQKENEVIIANIKENLIKFAMINKYLPCPDTESLAGRDGRENRGANQCLNYAGGVPYSDIGLGKDDVLDAQGNPIRYAVNRETVNQLLVCDATSSASYFCNLTPGSAIFNFINTPPIAGNDGTGNYTVCGTTTNTCNASTAARHLLTSSAAAVLVAYGDLGPDGIAASQFKCGAANNNAEKENCDATDDFYHQAQISSADNAGFDDVIGFITGSEIKSEILMPITVWNTLGNIPPPTYSNYDLDPGGYTPLDDEGTPDVIQVNRNISTSLDLGKGDDYVLIGNDLSSGLEYINETGEITDKGSKADLFTGEGNDTVYIVGEAHSDVVLGAGDDTFILGTNLTEVLSADSGNDTVWIQGNVESTATMTMGTGNDTLYLGQVLTDEFGRPVFVNASNEVVTVPYFDGKPYFIDQDGNSTVKDQFGNTVPVDEVDTRTGGGELSQNVYGDDGYDVLVLESMTESEWNSSPSFRSKVVGFELIIFKEDAVTGNRNYTVN